MAELPLFSHEEEHTQCGHTLSQKYANSWNKREMKSERPQLRNARNPWRNACGQAAAPPTHRGLGDPRGAPGPRGGPSAPDGASSPETEGRQQHPGLRHRNRGSGAAGTRTRGKEPPEKTKKS